MPSPPRKQSTSPAVDGLVLPPDKAEYCSVVRLHSSESPVPSEALHAQPGHILAVVVRDGATKNKQEACLLVLKDQQDPRTLPVIVQVLPIYSSLKIDISQVKHQEKNAQPALLVKFSHNQTSICMTFPEKQAMLDIVAEVRRLHSIAEECGYREGGDNHHWIDAYKKAKEIIKDERKLSRASTVSSKDTSSIPYVLPLQRSETLANLHLRRAKTARAKRAPELTHSTAKQHWINARLMDQEDQFVDWQDANIFAGTWNVHGSSPPPTLSTWLLGTLRTKEASQFDPDFYVIGLQEMETGTEAYIRYDPAKETAWVHAILETLKSAKRNYAKVASKQLVTMLLIVIAKTDIMPAVSEVQTCYAGVGLMNMMGNKGGVAIRFRYHDSYLCFVTSHLAAFLDKTEKRNQDFTEISKRLFFPNQLDPITDYVNYSWNNGGDEGVAFLDSNGVIRPWSKEVSIFHADHLIWVGDLNYRINLTEPEIKARVQRGELDLLLEYDQLSIERQAGRTFPMFDEGKINFLPTYKYDPGTNQYDTSEKRRAPSWTDRILWKKMTVDDSADDNEKPTSKLKLLDYNNCMEMMVSDHKPVRALMQAKIRKINEKKQKATREELIRQLKETQDNLTKGQISTSFVDFGDVQFLEYKEKKIVLENTGQVLAPFCFISKMDQDNVCPPWLQIQPLSGVIGPGEKVVIQFELMIDPTFSPPFNQGQEKIDDILVLRLVNGKDFFIVISGNYIPTCFGMPLDKLAQMTVPVNQVSLGAVTAKEQPASPAQVRPQQASLPKELWRVLNFLWNKNMLCITSLFLKHGDPVISKYIRKCLDTGEQFDNSVLLGGSIDNDEDESNDDTSTSNDNAHKEAIGANSMIDVLIAFLECLPEPVIPSDLYTQALDAADMVEVMSLLRENLPAIHFNVVLYIIDFLRDAIRYAPSESRDERRRFIVEKFTVLLRPPIGFKERNPASAQLKRIDFIRKLLKSS